MLGKFNMHAGMDEDEKINNDNLFSILRDRINEEDTQNS